jgi:beta-1,4-mannosyltransferase
MPRSRGAPGSADEHAARLVVLQSFPAPRPSTNPYLCQLADGLSRLADIRYFSWRQALTGRFDVFHLHWPEVAVRGRTIPRTLARRLLFLLVLARIRVTGRALVRTVHNVSPHETGPWSERLVLRLCDRWTTAWITLTPFTATPSGAPAVTIRHGHYRNWFAGHPQPRPVAARLLYFGLIRRYKGVLDLVDVLAGAPHAAVTLRLLGRATEPDLADAIRCAVAADDRISAVLDYVAEDVLAEEIGRAELVVLPYHEMHNSGSALLALSLGRPVLIPAGAISAALAEEVGPGWVQTFSAPLTIEAIEAALAAVRPPPAGLPDLSLRDWDQLVDQHLSVYRSAVHGTAPTTDLVPPTRE